MLNIVWLIFNGIGVILCLEVKELRTLYAYIYIFM